MIFMEAIKLSSEASEPLGMRGPEKRPWELQRAFFSFIFGQHIKTIWKFTNFLYKHNKKVTPPP